jgi:hypothetical protein
MASEEARQVELPALKAVDLRLYRGDLKGRGKPPLEIPNLAMHWGQTWGVVASQPWVVHTVVRGLLCAHPPHSGEVRWSAGPWDGGVVFQQPPTYHGLSVLEHIHYLGLVAGQKPRRWPLRGAGTTGTLERLQSVVEDFGQRRPVHLSPAQLRRSALCFALVHDPRIIGVEPPPPGVGLVEDARLLASLRGLTQIEEPDRRLWLIGSTGLSVLAYGVTHLACFDGQGLAWQGSVEEADPLLGSLFLKPLQGGGASAVLASAVASGGPDGPLLARAEFDGAQLDRLLGKLCRAGRGGPPGGGDEA